MKSEDFEKLTASIQTKLGKEASSKIADDLGKLITDNNLMNKEIENKNNTINQLKSDKELLMETNMSLLQQVGSSAENDFVDKPIKKEEPKTTMSIRDCFDKNGNFIK